MKNQEKEQTEDDVVGCFEANYLKPRICPVATGGWCKDYTKCKSLDGNKQNNDLGEQK